MPKAWSNKDERQYEHIKKSERGGGRSPRRAREIAARTVNKQRREEGRTGGQKGGRVLAQRGGRTAGQKGRRRTAGGGVHLERRPLTELRSLASRLEIPGRSRMRKEQLVQAIRQARQ